MYYVYAKDEDHFYLCTRKGMGLTNAYSYCQRFTARPHLIVFHANPPVKKGQSLEEGYKNE